MAGARPAFWFGWCTVVATLLLQIPVAVHSRGSRYWSAAAFVFALVAVLFQLASEAWARGRHQRWMRRVFWSALGVTWAAFWWFDLRDARVQLMLIMVPVAGGCGALLGRWMRRHARLRDKRERAALPSRIAIAFMVPAAALVWGYFALRSDNGCTGVSPSYQLTLVITAMLVFGAGPTMVWSHLTSPVAPRRRRRLNPGSPYRAAADVLVS